VAENSDETAGSPSSYSEVVTRELAIVVDAGRRGSGKARGDVLVKQGKSNDALAKYAEALQYAPNWKQFKEAREAAAKQSH
jgi:hypothetical protein